MRGGVPDIVIKLGKDREELQEGSTGNEAILFRAKRGLYSGSIGFCTASLRASKTSFCLSTVSQAPSPAPGTSNRVDYLHHQRRSKHFVSGKATPIATKAHAQNY